MKTNVRFRGSLSKDGFTLIELLSVIILIIGIMLIVLPKITGSVKNKELAINTSYENIIYKALDLYISDNSRNYPKVTTNTYCVAVDTLKGKGYLKDYDNENVKAKNIVKVTYSGGYHYEMVDECTEQIIDYDKCTKEGKCSACIVLADYDSTKNVYKYIPKIIKDVKLDALSDITVVTNNDECIKEAIISAAKEFVSKYPDKFSERDGNTYCIKVSTLINENMLGLGAFTTYNDLPVTDYSVEVKYSGSRFSYDIKLKGECKVSITSTCIATIDAGGNKVLSDHYKHPEWAIIATVPKLDENNKLIFEIGDEYYCNISGPDKKKINNHKLLFGRYYILSIDSENNLINLMSESEYGGVPNIYYWIKNSDFNNLKAKFGYPKESTISNLFGPVSIMQTIYNETKDWNVPNININFRDPYNAKNSSNGYYGIYTIGNTTYILNRYATSSSDISHASWQAPNLKARLATKEEIQALLDTKKDILRFYTLSEVNGRYTLSAPNSFDLLDSYNNNKRYLYDNTTMAFQKDSYEDERDKKYISTVPISIDENFRTYRPVISIPMSDFAPTASSTNDLSY